jgi:hypothetical protein
MKFKKLLLAGLAMMTLLPSLALGAPTLEALLQQGKIDAVKGENGYYKIPVELQGETVMIFAQEIRLGSSDIRVVDLYAMVLELPDNYKMSEPMLQKMNDLNNRLSFGKVYREDNYIFYRSSFLLRTADPDSLGIELELAHVQRQALKKELQPFAAQ